MIILRSQPKRTLFILLFVEKQIRGSGRKLHSSKYKKRIQKLLVLKCEISFEIKKLLVQEAYPRNALSFMKVHIKKSKRALISLNLDDLSKIQVFSNSPRVIYGYINGDFLVKKIAILGYVLL